MRFLAFAPDVNIVWLLTSKGEMLISAERKFKYPQYDEPIRVVAQPDPPYNTRVPQPDPSLSLALVDLVREKDKQITTQAEEIGRLKAENKQLREEAQKQSRHERGLLTHDNVASRP